MDIVQHLTVSTAYRQAGENQLCLPGSSSKHLGTLLELEWGLTYFQSAEAADYTECLKVTQDLARCATAG